MLVDNFPENSLCLSQESEVLNFLKNIHIVFLKKRETGIEPA